MSCFSRFAALTLAAVTPLVILPGAADAQRRTVPHHPPHPQPAVAVRGMSSLAATSTLGDIGRRAFMVQVPVGKHHIEVTKAGYRQFATDIEVHDGETSPLNVSLMSGTR